MLTPSQAALSFYCEVYRDSARTVSWLVRVLDPQGRSIVATQPAQAALGPGGGPLTGALDLSGLPPGAYRLALVIGSGADTVSHTAPFRMGGFEAEQRVEAVARAAEEPNDLFARLGEAQLDTLYEPLIYLSNRGELGVYRGLTLDGKRRFLRDFWRKRDTTPATSENEEMAAFLACAKIGRLRAWGNDGPTGAQLAMWAPVAPLPTICQTQTIPAPAYGAVPHR